MKKLATGLVRTSHGVKGFLKVKSYSGEFEHLAKLKEMTLKREDREKTFTVDEVRPFMDGALVKLHGIDTPEAARAYINWEILVDREDAAELDEDEFYFADLCGLDVLCDGEVVARVASVSTSAASELLELVTSSGTFYVPFIDQFIGAVSIEDNTIELKDRRLVE